MFEFVVFEGTFGTPIKKMKPHEINRDNYNKRNIDKRRFGLNGLEPAQTSVNVIKANFEQGRSNSESEK